MRMTRNRENLLAITEEGRRSNHHHQPLRTDPSGTKNSSASCGWIKRKRSSIAGADERLRLERNAYGILESSLMRSMQTFREPTKLFLNKQWDIGKILPASNLLNELPIIRILSSSRNALAGNASYSFFFYVSKLQWIILGAVLLWENEETEPKPSLLAKTAINSGLWFMNWVTSSDFGYAFKYRSLELLMINPLYLKFNSTSTHDPIEMLTSTSFGKTSWLVSITRYNVFNVFCS